MMEQGSTVEEVRTETRADVEKPPRRLSVLTAVLRRELPWFGCVLLVIAAALHSANRSIGGGDTWVAMANGRYTCAGDWATHDEGRTLQMKVLDVFGIHMTKQDYMGARTRDYVPGDHQQFGWLNQNWLTHVAFYKMREAWGEHSLLVYKFAQAILTALFAYWAARVLGAHPLLAGAAAAFGILLSRSFIDFRPNQSTIFYAMAMLVALVYWRQGRKGPLWWLFPIMLLWSNVHGGFIYAIMIFVVMIGGHVIQHFLGRATVAFVILGFIVALVLILGGQNKLRPQLETLRSDGVKSFERQKSTQPNASEEKLAAIEAKALRSYTNMRRWVVAGYLAALAIAGIIVTTVVRCTRFTRDSFAYVDGKRLVYLLGGGAAVVMIPGIFSPFGFENVLHPLIVAVGNEGEIWRQVVEWRPIWDLAGFGNAGPYSYFLWVFAVVVVLWWALYFFKPAPAVDKNGAKTEVEFWPKIDLAFIGVMAITLIMSIKSRRFIFLGGLVLAPFLAQMAQEIINMFGLLRSRRRELLWALPRMPRPVAAVGIAGSLVATGIVATIFGSAMQDIYLKPPRDGADLSVFRRMVGIPAQPVEAIKFFDLNEVEGTVFNEWVNGGFITFSQTPNPETGRVKCKVHMDGRAQAAYHLEHFQRWNSLKAAALPRGSRSARRRFRQLTEQHKLSTDDPRVYEKMLAKAKDDKSLANQLNALAMSVPGLYGEIQRQKLAIQARQWGIDTRQPKWRAKMVRTKGYEDIRAYRTLARLASGDRDLYNEMLKAEGINVVLLDGSKPHAGSVADTLTALPDWRLFYLDHKNLIFARDDGQRNEKLFADPRSVAYPSETARNISLGYALGSEKNPASRREGFELMLAAEPQRYTSRLYEGIYNAGAELLSHYARQRDGANRGWVLDQMTTFFEREYETHRKKVDAGEQFGINESYACLLHAGSVAQQLALMRRDKEAADAYKKALAEYSKAQKDLLAEAKSRRFW